jgi:1,4-alpha-glucan branching enzyme
MVDRNISTTPNSIAITFRLPDTVWADRVCVVGDFNQWQVGATPMRLIRDFWQVTLELPTEGRFEYRYIINEDEWLNDWRADSSAPNLYGGENSVLLT